jgi:hypothetical protein
VIGALRNQLTRITPLIRLLWDGWSASRYEPGANHQGPKCFSIHLKIMPIANHATKAKNPTW